MTGLFQLAFSGRQAENMPRWANSRFDIVAKTPANTAPFDRTTLGAPLQALLRDRFKLTWHTEQRPGTSYILRAVKPRMQKADPASRTSCKYDMPQSGSQGGAWSTRLTCRNVTMTQFADWLAKSGRALPWGTVSNATGLDGAWNFTLVYNTAPMQPTPRAEEAAASGGGPIAPEPVAEYSIFEAMEKQLGLKLETIKGVRQVMVIDHIEEKPTDQ
jgi:uncharacterized protein (TIGR03435 family)